MARKVRSEVKRNGKVRVVAGADSNRVDALRDEYRESRAASRLDDACFDSVVRWAIERGELRSLGYPVDLPIRRGDTSPMAFVVAARTLSAFTRGAKTGVIAAPRYLGNGRTA